MDIKLDFTRQEMSVLTKQARSIAKNSRNCGMTYMREGKGISHTLWRAFALCAKKVSCGTTLNGAEKWYFDNWYLCGRALQSLRRTVRLPSAGKATRIEELADCLVLGSKKCLDRDRVLAVLSAAGAESELSFAEYKHFGRALTSAALDGMYILATRILYHDKMQRFASKEYVCPSLFGSDLYLYYALNNEKIATEIEGSLRCSKIEVQSSYVNSMLSSESLAEYLFDILRNSSEVCSYFALAEVSAAVKMLSATAGYRQLTESTKGGYLQYVEHTAKVCGLSETQVVEQLQQYAVLKSRTVGEIIYNNGKEFVAYLKGGSCVVSRIFEDCAEHAYVAFCVIVSLAVSVVLGYYFLGWFALLFPLPLVYATERLLLSLLSGIKKRSVVPAINLEKLNNNTRTAVVISHYITSPTQLDEAILRAETIKAVNKDKFLDVVLLLDFKSAESATTDEDAELIAKFTKLKDKENFNILLRKRVCFIGGFGGRERKRGAIEDLNYLYASGDESPFRIILNTVSVPKYVLLLDADSTLDPHAVVQLVGVMEHPANAGYDLCALRAKCDLFSLETPFSKRWFDVGGLEHYPQYSSAYYRLFGKELFCGKGIYRVASYTKKISGIFPDNKILSHDVLEGAVLSTVGNGVVYEDAPQSFVEEEARKARWMRGDIQLLPFCGGRWKNRDGKKVKTNVSAFYSFIMLQNAFVPLKDLCLFAALVCGAVWSLPVLFAVVAYFLLPIATSIVQQIREAVDGKRVRYAVKACVKTTLMQLENFFLLPYRAVQGAYIFIVTSLRMLFAKNLLQWKTFFETHGETSLSSYVRLFAPPLLLETVLLALSLVFLPVQFWWFAIYVVLTFAVYLLQVLMGFKPSAKPYSTQDVHFLRDIAAKTYSYFQFMRDRVGLVPDNYQVCPALGKSPRTSPTNIGFQLAAEVSAYYLGFADISTVCKNISDDLKKIEKLKKWKGNLYNWYSCDGKVLSPYVSSVDSGNLVACLNVVAGFAAEVGEADIKAKVQKLIDKTDLSALYDADKGLFYLGYDKSARKFGGHYDLLASESRLLSYIFAAKTENTAHWRRLSREYTEYRGNTLLSWSGTMFEYLMPTLFFDAAQGSFIDRSEINSVYAQRAAGQGSLWGRSESCEKRFDISGWYQYRAFGVQKIALRSQQNEKVLAPYAGVLALMKRKFSIKVLFNFSRKNVCGKFGFYEAYDCDKNGGKIFSYMTHHQGMILCALLNCLCDKKLQKLSLKSIEMSGARSLLAEKTPEKRSVRKSIETCQYQPKTLNDYYKLSANKEYSSKIFALTDGISAVKVNSFGDNSFKRENVLFAKPKFYQNEATGVRIFTKVSNEKFADIRGVYDEKGVCKIYQNKTQIFAVNSFSGCEEIFSKDACLDARWIKIKVPAKKGEQAEIFYLEEVILASLEQFLSHPAYCKMGLKLCFDAERKTVTIVRLGATENDNKYAAIAFRGLSRMKVCFDKSAIYARNNIDKINFDCCRVDDYGRYVNPIVAVRGIADCFVDDAYEIETAAFFANNEKELNTKIEAFCRAEKGFSSVFAGVNLYDDALIVNVVNALSLAVDKEKLSQIYYKGETAQYLDCCRGGRIILYLFHGDESELASICQAVRVAESLDCKFSMIVGYVAKNPAYFARLTKLLDNSFLSYYRIVDMSDDEVLERYKRFAHVVFDNDLKALGVDCNDWALKDLDVKTSAEKVPNGGFSAAGYTINAPIATPYANIVAGRNGGFVVTENGGGYTFFGNSREQKATAFCADPIYDAVSEGLFVKVGGVYRINCGGVRGGATTHSIGTTRFYNDFGTFLANVDVFTLNEGSVKVYKATIEGAKHADLLCAYAPCLGWRPQDDFIFSRGSGDTIVSTSLLSGQSLYVRVLSSLSGSIGFSAANAKNPYIKFSFNTSDTAVVYFVMSSSEPDILHLTAQNVEKLKTDFTQVENVSLECADKPLENIFPWLAYQTVSSRLNAKCGYYQTGGAVGFRDQLQDAVSIAIIDDSRLRERILEAARHQYVEGDVQHWWHTATFGVRTTVSDDKLFLPWAVGEYLKTTGDRAILKEELHYLSSAPLNVNETSRVENATVTDYTESLEKHCNRALKNALHFGSHGLLVMGGGDWNDSFDLVGRKMHAESVVTSLIATIAIDNYKPYLKDRDRMALSGIQKQIKDAVNKHAFSDDRYARLFDDNGNILGLPDTEKLTIDLVPQTLAVLSGTAEGEVARRVLSNLSELVDSQNFVVKLLSPPQKQENGLGYVATYPDGVRENGGQYTHAALWYVAALLKIGEVEAAYRILSWCNPAWRAADENVFAKYKSEPYSVCADIYAEGPETGKGGWSWYTASSGWLFRIVVEGFFGITRQGNYLDIKPRLPKVLDNSVMTYTHGKATVKIKFKKADTRRVVYDGIVLSGDDRIPLVADKNVLVLIEYV